ncbi:MAG TPA: MdtA/MuxA family multidrug efflux RND transporter periplasmic adaptor subunit [Usitatibacter sp.]|nr:MdtA/MuxA family multidrug efflux RND transporter periplasmic adaptor subunit [Usitatibacter sp.]
MNANREHPRAGTAASFAPALRRSWMVASVLVVLLGIYTMVPLPGKSQARAAKPDPASGPKAIPVATARARSADIDVNIDALGSVTPLSNITLRSRLDGQLTSVRFSEGQTVRAGELLAEIDPRPYQVALAQAEAQLARDEAVLRNARADLERYRMLHEKRLITVQQLDTQASLVRQHEATLKMSQAAVDSAKLQLGYTRITAPIMGRVGLRQVDQGNMVRANDANGIVVLTQLQPITVLFNIPEDRVRAVMKKLQAGEKLRVEAYDRAGKAKLATGQLLTVDNQIDPATGTVKLKAQFANDDFSLFPNQFVNVRMRLDVEHDATLIPSAAVQRGTQGTFVYAVGADHTVQMRPVTLGATENGNVAVASGIAPDDVVVVDGADKLRQGAKVEFASAGGGADKAAKKASKDRSASASEGQASGG